MKLAIITGGSKGLGAALAACYLKEGFEVVEFSRSAPHPFSVTADLSQPVTAMAAIAGKLSQLGAGQYQEIAIISNAGIVQPVGPTAGKETADILANVNTNFVGAILFITEVLRQFRDHNCKKTIAHITSGAALRGYAGWSLYCGAKAGMEKFIESVSLEQQAEAHPFYVISIDPGVMDTEMQAGIRATNPADFPTLERFLDLKRSGTLMPPDLIAGAVLKIIKQNGRSGIRYSSADFLP